jgi:hypothetical protein
MARLKGPIQFTGRLGGIHSYYDSRIKAYVVATNGGASKELIMNNPTFARTRENMNEFKACGMWASLLRKSLACIAHLYSGYYFSDIMSLSKKIQNRDDVTLKGFRSIESRRYPNGFSTIKFNREKPLDRVCLFPFNITLSDDKTTVTMNIAQLRPYSHIHWPSGYKSFRFLLVALELADMVYNQTARCYEPAVSSLESKTAITTSAWMSAVMNPADFTMATSLAAPAMQNQGTVVLVALGVELSKDYYNSRDAAATAQGTMGIVECFVE